MAFGTITSTSNTFGSVDGTATGVVPGTLSGSIGVPGPAGPTGPQGPAGAAGQGVPAGGTAGQFLTKIDGTNYNTDWTTINVSSKRDLTDYDFTNVTDTKLDTFGLTIDALTTEAWTCDSFLKGSELQLTTDTSANGGQVGEYFQTKATVQKVTGLFKSFGDVDGIIVLQNDLAYISPLFSKP